jgi:hypothetical protein
VSVTPVNPARLSELHHQRALVREHLAWLDREIDRESAGFTPPDAVPIAQPSPLAPSQSVAEFEAYTPDPISAAKETRRGCFIVLAAVVLLIAAALSAIYILRYSDRPLLFPAKETAVDGGRGE